VIKRKLPEFDDDRFREAEVWAPGVVGEGELLAWAGGSTGAAGAARQRAFQGWHRSSGDRR
jgi:hypothetical protein